MWTELKKLWQYRELLFSMVRRELKVRYKNSVLGFFWSLLNPLFTVIVLSYALRLSGGTTKNFTAYILAAYLPYMFFQMAVLDSTQSILSNLSLVKKIYFPREILPLATIIGNFIHFVLAMSVYFLYLFAVYLRDPRVFPIQPTVVYLPIIILINFTLATGLGLFFSAINTFYEDVKYVVTVMMTMLFFVSPIMYFSEMTYYPPMGSVLHYKLYHLLNPIATLSTAYRKLILAPQAVRINGIDYPALPIDWRMISYMGVFSVIMLVVGYAVFNRMKWRFVERP